jgi:hypothetical protein
VLQIAPPIQQATLGLLFQEFGPTLFALGWILVALLVLWTAWEVYKIIKMIDYISAIQWTYLQITVPEDSEETPKSMEIAYDIWGAIHKGPDLNEKYFDGYLEAWYSCEVQCTAGRARYIMVVPTAHRKVFEGVIYGQYPQAEIKEVEDYTQRYDWKNIRQTFELFGTEIELVKDDIYPIKTYRDYEASLAEEERFVDPHQALVEAFTHVGPGEEFWMQVVIRPMDAGDMAKWTEKGEAEVSKISGQAKESPPTIGAQLFDWAASLPGEIIATILRGPQEPEQKKDEKVLRFFNPVDEAKMKGILQKVSQSGYKTKIRVIHIAP